MKRIITFGYLTLSLVSFKAYPQIVVDIDQELRARISRALPRTYPNSNITMGAIEFTIISAPINYDLSNLQRVPGIPSEQTFRQVNCADVNMPFSEQFTLSTSLVRKLSWSRKVSSTRSYTVRIDFPGIITGVTGGASSSYSETVDITNSQEVTRTETQQSTRTVNLTIPARQTFFIKYSRTISNNRIPFTGRVIIDGRVYTTVRQGRTTLEGWDRLRRILTEEERSFDVAGIIEGSSADDLQVTYSNRPVTESECSDVPASVIKDQELTSQVYNALWVNRNKILSKEELKLIDFYNNNPSRKPIHFFYNAQKVSPDTYKDLSFKKLAEEDFDK